MDRGLPSVRSARGLQGRQELGRMLVCVTDFVLRLGALVSRQCTWSGSVRGSGSGPKNGTRANSIREVKRRPAGSAGRADRRRRIGPRRRNFQRSKTPTGSPTKSRVHFGMCAWCCEFLTGARACSCARIRVNRWAYVCLCTCTCI